MVEPVKISIPLQSGNPKYPSTHRSHLAPVISTDLQVQFPTLLHVWLVDPLASQPQAKLNQSVKQNPIIVNILIYLDKWDIQRNLVGIHHIRDDPGIRFDTCHTCFHQR